MNISRRELDVLKAHEETVAAVLRRAGVSHRLVWVCLTLVVLVRTRRESLMASEALREAGVNLKI